MSAAAMIFPTRFIALSVLLLLVGCGQGQQQQAAPPPPAVTVAQPVKRTIVDQDEYVGRFVAVDSVEIRARVSGYLDKVHFTDGQIVKEGDLLFAIDNRPTCHSKGNILHQQPRLVLRQLHIRLKGLD